MISGWVHDQNVDGATPTINRDVLLNVSTRQTPSVTERARRLLFEAIRRTRHLGDEFTLTDPGFISATYSQNADEVDFLAQFSIAKGWIEYQGMGGLCKVTPDGYIEADQQRLSLSQSNKCFVAMWFDESLTGIYDSGFQIGILNAGYNPIRIDRVEHTNRIDDEIIAGIRNSRFIVADFTGHRGGVYFEAGYALGLGLPVIWCCRIDDVENLHFDIRQYNCIVWENADDLAEKLSRRIAASVGIGPLAINRETTSSQTHGE
jgi:nucleoside 2-deoxyribosyltransferase